MAEICSVAKQKTIPLGKMKPGELPIVVNLPASTNEGIGKLIMTHAILETQVTELLYDLAQISYPAGRVSYGYRNAFDRFKTVVELLDMHGMVPRVDVKKLQKQIEQCCWNRDTFAHNVWLEDKNGVPRIRVAKGTVETPEGKHNFKFVPGIHLVPDEYFPSMVQITRSTIATVLDLKKEVLPGTLVVRRSKPMPEVVAHPSRIKDANRLINESTAAKQKLRHCGCGATEQKRPRRSGVGLI